MSIRDICYSKQKEQLTKDGIIFRDKHNYFNFDLSFYFNQDFFRD